MRRNAFVVSSLLLFLVSCDCGSPTADVSRKATAFRVGMPYSEALPHLTGRTDLSRVYYGDKGPYKDDPMYYILTEYDGVQLALYFDSSANIIRIDEEDE
jgi:hypothetical protein